MISLLILILPDVGNPLPEVKVIVVSAAPTLPFNVFALAVNVESPAQVVERMGVMPLYTGTSSE